VTSPYRSEIDALRERKETLEEELARLKQQTTALEGLRTREQELERELAAVAQKIGAGTRRGLPLLEQVRVASPCTASWDEMLGDDRVRFCVGCEKNVYNLSAMATADAERLLQERIGAELCVRFYQRTDGTIMTEDCPVGVKKKRRKKLALAVAGAGAMALAATSMLSRSVCHVQGEVSYQPTDDDRPVTMGEATAEPPTVTPPTPHVMGTAAPIVTAPKPPTVMGRRAPVPRGPLTK
jgi:hypothetical protein